MAGLMDLPAELHAMIIRYLAGTPSINTFALACKVTSKCVGDFRDSEKAIDLRSGRVALIHRVIAGLASQANNVAIVPPDIAIRSTGNRFADSVLIYASYFRTIQLSLSNRDGVAAPVSQQLRGVYQSLVAQLDPQLGSSNHVFWNGGMSQILPFLMRVTQYISTLELRGSLLWMQRADLSGLFTELNTLQLSGLAASVLPSSCEAILRLPSLNRLEFSDMDISYNTVKELGALSVTRLHFVNCYVDPLALPKAIYACLALKSFVYILRTAQWNTGMDYSLTQLLHALSSCHALTLLHLTIRTLGVRVDHKECQYSEEIMEFKKLQTLSIDYHLLHFDHVNAGQDQCKRTYKNNCLFFTSPNPSPLKPAQVLSGLAESLYRLELHNCKKVPMWYVLHNVLDAKLKERLRSLRAVKVTYERHPPSETIWTRASTQVLRNKAATVPQFHLELVDLP